MEPWQGRMEIPMLLVLSGYLLIQFFEHTVAPHFHFGEETHTHEMLHRPVMFAAIGGLAMHTFFDGVAIASGFNISPRLGLLIFIAIMLHKLPEGFTVASIALASGRTIASARWATMFVAAATLAGVAVMAAVKGAVIYALPFSAGVTLYVAASDLIPEVNKAGRGFISIVVFAGVALYYMTERMLEAFGL
jgi:zinc transporter ZupT